MDFRRLFNSQAVRIAAAAGACWAGLTLFLLHLNSPLIEVVRWVPTIGIVASIFMSLTNSAGTFRERFLITSSVSGIWIVEGLLPLFFGLPPDMLSLLFGGLFIFMAVQQEQGW